MSCVCGAGASYDRCCGPLHKGRRHAASPEALMRSRYTAYVEKNYGYILGTTDPECRDQIDHDANRAWMMESTFNALTVLESSQQGSEGIVEFIARFRRGSGPEQIHHERSRFRRRRGRWYFCGAEDSTA